ncbi:alpha/beta hydrolase [Actinacidiphila acidipaludis]|uniref:Esterase family protein n=1 Tax=Actinacidiphila acidipaludis TaxID=2873382 RepID=A0ABS7Q1J6_9ACTN|nr:alpha/beta fold hydrolase [Streptomyces acidipaludis]MBY8877015.1 esterase family protein [Streptomyces acidipaludis]
MGLTSMWFAILLIAVTIGAVAAALTLWPRVRGPRALRFVSRIGMIVLCQVTAVFVVMVAINNQYGFYASWDDLLGNANSGGRPTASPSGGPVPAVPDYAVKFTPYSQGFERATVRGWASGTKGDVIVWLPPQYGKKEFAHTRFPVIEVLHGIPGTPHSFLRGMRLGQIMQEQITAGRAEPAILVLPTITPDRVNTGCADVPGKSRVATWLTKDVVRTINHNFRTLPAPRGWAVMGISTGGYCAARLALEHPETFAAGAALAPDDPAQGVRNPLQLARTSRPDVQLLVESSLQDPESPPKFADEICAAVRPPATVTTMRVANGGHNWKTWGRMFPDAFTWVSGRIEAPRAVPLAPSAAP